MSGVLLRVVIRPEKLVSFRGLKRHTLTESCVHYVLYAERFSFSFQKVIRIIFEGHFSALRCS